MAKVQRSNRQRNAFIVSRPPASELALLGVHPHIPTVLAPNFQALECDN
jgi:hypothetical protein